MTQQHYTECCRADSEKNYFDYDERVIRPITQELAEAEDRRTGDISTPDQSTPEEAADKEGMDHKSGLSEIIRSDGVSGVGDQTTSPGVQSPL